MQTYVLYVDTCRLVGTVGDGREGHTERVTLKRVPYHI